jgi:hypothetical protein
MIVVIDRALLNLFKARLKSVLLSLVLQHLTMNGIFLIFLSDASVSIDLVPRERIRLVYVMKTTPIRATEGREGNPRKCGAFEG